MSNFEIEKEEEVDNNSSYIKESIVNEKLEPKERLKLATTIIIGLGLFYFAAMVLYSFINNEHLKFIFTTTKELIMNFGGLLIGFYFYRK